MYSVGVEFDHTIFLTGGVTLIGALQFMYSLYLYTMATSGISQQAITI